MGKIQLLNLKCVHENVNLDEYLMLYKIVKKSMKRPEWLGDFSKADLKRLLQNNIKLWLYYLDDELVCSMMWIKATKNDIEKINVSLDFNGVAEYGPMMVHPKYIGNHLQYQMLQVMDQYSKERGYSYIVSTIHPDNIYSINNLVKDHFEFVTQKKYRRGIRNIYVKKLDQIEQEGEKR